MWTTSGFLSSSSPTQPPAPPLSTVRRRRLGTSTTSVHARRLHSHCLRRRRRRSSIPLMSSPPPSSPSSLASDALTAAGRLLWGRGLPPQLLVAAVRTSWSAAWQLMMRQLAPASSSGSYARPAGAFPSVPDRYLQNLNRNLHLYAALPCPWAHRALIVRALKGLHSALPVSIAAPGADGSWEFLGTDAGVAELVPGSDRANGRRTLREVYGLRRGGYDGRATVPMLWDAETKEVVCNESYAIIEFLNSATGAIDGGGGWAGMDLCPPELKHQIDEWNRVIYPNVNNGVYRCGFAQSQEAYDTAADGLFNTFDMLESHLSSSRYLCEDVLTLADVCLFTTLIRFDLVYNILFKCTKRKLVEYPNLYGYTCSIYQIPEVAATCNLEAIMDGYYCTLFPLNPGGIRPVMPYACEQGFLTKVHNREHLSLNSKQPARTKVS